MSVINVILFPPEVQNCIVCKASLLADDIIYGVEGFSDIQEKENCELIGPMEVGSL